MGRRTRHRPEDHGLTPSDPTGAAGLTRVEACLHVGDFPAATHAWHAVEAGGWLAHVSGMPRTDPARLRAAAIAAELAFAQGRPAEAQAVLADYLAHPEDFLAPDNGLSVHAKLQLAEWYYARRESAIAVHLAERLLAACDPEGYAAEGRVPARYASVQPYLEDLGELHYYLARFYSRLHKYAAVDQQCDQALEAFARAALLDPGPQESLRIRWRIGLILMVAGFTHWRAGSLAKATSQLQTAKWLLHPTRDVISQANVEQYLGGLQRSQGQYTAAVASLERARDIYRREHHPRELSRVQTELGRTYLEQGADDQADASLGEALAFARRSQQGRDEVESLVCLSWLSQRRGPEQLEVAAGYATQALACKVADGEVLGIEAKLALGHCRLRQGRYAEAKNNLEVALAHAAALGIVTHQIRAHLALAELFVAPSVKDVSTALHHYRQADTLLATTASPPLQQVARRVKHTLDASQGELLVIRADDLWACGLKATEQRLQIWAIERALQQAQGRKSDIARRLQLSRPGLAKMWARLFAHEPSAAPAKPPG